MSLAYVYPTVAFQGMTFTAKRWGQFPTITYVATPAVTAGNEIVTVNSSLNITVVIEDTVSTTAQVKAAIEATSPSLNGLSAGDLVSIVENTPGTVTTGVSSAMTGAVAPNTLGFFLDEGVSALTSSFVYYPFALRFLTIVISNDDPSGTNRLVFSWDGVNNHGILDPGESVTLDKANQAAIFLKYINGAPAYRVTASGAF
jgi:hypothetical protein